MGRSKGPLREWRERLLWLASHLLQAQGHDPIPTYLYRWILADEESGLWSDYVAKAPERLAQDRAKDPTDTRTSLIFIKSAINCLSIQSGAPKLEDGEYVHHANLFRTTTPPLLDKCLQSLVKAGALQRVRNGFYKAEPVFTPIPVPELLRVVLDAEEGESEFIGKDVVRRHKRFDTARSEKKRAATWPRSLPPVAYGLAPRSDAKEQRIIDLAGDLMTLLGEILQVIQARSDEPQNPFAIAFTGHPDVSRDLWRTESKRYSSFLDRAEKQLLTAYEHLGDADRGTHRKVLDNIPIPREEETPSSELDRASEQIDLPPDYPSARGFQEVMVPCWTTNLRSILTHMGPSTS